MSIAFVAMYTGGTLFQISFAAGGVVNGPVIALLIIGAVLPSIVSRAAGYICSFSFMF